MYSLPGRPRPQFLYPGTIDTRRHRAAVSLIYPQNIRNNKTKARTPKWAARYGLVDTSTLERKQKRSQWAARYNERNPNTTLAGQQYEEGQTRGDTADDYGENRPARQPGEGEHDLWNPSEESFYTDEQRASALEGGRSRGWHYPANFNEALPPEGSKKKKKDSSSKKDRWARTEDAYNKPAPERRKSRRSRPETSSMRTDSTTDIPEDAEGGLYGSSQPARSNGATYDTPNRDGSRTPPARRPANEAEEFAHTF